MKLTDFLLTMDDIAPLFTQEMWDNSGLQIELGTNEVSKVLVALEITDEIIDEAIKEKADMIVTHHPLIFNPPKQIMSVDADTNHIIRLIKAGIQVYSSHTPFDKAYGGNNDYILDLLGCTEVDDLEDEEDEFMPNIIHYGKLPKPVKMKTLVAKLDKVLEHPGLIRTVGDLEEPVQFIAVCTGAAGDLWQEAFFDGADVLITGEAKHHEAVAAKENGFKLIEAGHAGTEWIFVPNMTEQIKACLPQLKVVASKSKQIPYNEK